MTLVLVNDPVPTAVSVVDVRRELNIEDSINDRKLYQYILVITDHLESRLGKKIVAQQWDYTTGGGWTEGDTLPLYPLISVDDITDNPDGTTTVRFTVGHDPVPESLRHTILYGVQILYDGGDLLNDSTFVALLIQHWRATL